MVKLPTLPKLDFLPNPPHKGLPTPQKWGQTWNALENNLVEKPKNILALATTTMGGALLGGAAGIAGPAIGTAAIVAIPIALAGIGTGVTTGLGVYGAAWKAFGD